MKGLATNMENERKSIIKIRGLKHYFPVRGKRDMFVKAVDGVDIDIYDGETLGIVGESGCGKSTLGRVLLQLYKQTEGSILYFGRSIDDIAPLYLRDMAKTLGKHKKKIADLDKVYKQRTKELEEDPENFAKIEALNRARREYDLAYFPVVNLFGGMLVKPEIETVKTAYLDFYNAAKKQVAINRRIKAIELDISEMEYAMAEHEEKEKAGKVAKLGKKTSMSTNKKTIDGGIFALNVIGPSKLEKLKKIKADFEDKAAEADKVVQEKQRAIDNIRSQYRNDPEFAEHEQHRTDGIDLSLLTYNEMRWLRSDMQLIFQDPYSSLNPRMTVGQIIGEGMRTHNFFKKNAKRQQEFTIEVMEECGLAPYMLHRYPNQFSGGQRQRIGIARALAVRPQFVVCDEAVSALDVSIQSQIINLLQDLREKSNLSYMFISHDLSVIKFISDRVGVMYLGNFVEIAATEKLYANPAHPYTVALIEAIPTTDADGAKKEMKILEGDIPSPVNPPSGCKFHTRCQYVTDICKEVTPLLEKIDEGHFVACHHKLNQT